MTTRDKILLTVFLAVLTSWLIGCANPKQDFKPVFTAASDRVTDLAFLKKTFNEYNDAYFEGKLAAPVITLDEPDDMASTDCAEGPCLIKFNLSYVRAPRVAQQTMLHEMCHEKTWDTDKGHGKVWRTCMLSLDAAGAFREVWIDNYMEKK